MRTPRIPVLVLTGLLVLIAAFVPVNAGVSPSVDQTTVATTQNMTSLITFGVRIASAVDRCKDDAWAESQLGLKVLGQDVPWDHCKWVYYDWNGPGDWVSLNKEWVGTLTQPSDKTPRVFFGTNPPTRIMVTGITARWIPGNNHQNIRNGNIDYCGFLRNQDAYGMDPERRERYHTLPGQLPVSC